MDETWFETTARKNFERAFLPSSNQPNLRHLQLGVFRGDASVWLLENVLTHPSSMLTDVDLWENGPEDIAEFDMSGEVFGEYKARIAGCNRVEFYRMNTLTFLSQSISFGRKSYDFIYIDADHATVPTLECAVLGYRLLKPGGLMCFDDYVWRSRHGMLHEPTTAIDLFKIAYGDRMRVLRVGSQCWMKRIV